MAISATQLSLALAQSPGIGSKTISRILARNAMLGTKPDAFAKLSQAVLQEEYRLPPSAAQEWVSRREQNLANARVMEARLSELGVRLACPVDAHYPGGIEELWTDPPGLLFLYGNIPLLDSPTFTVLSSRNSSPEARLEMEKLTEAGVLNHEVLVTGHDTPEYRSAAIVPLRWGAPRILVLDNGMFHALGENLTQEPFQAARLWRYQFDPKADLVVSAINPTWNTHRGANQQRDRLIGALSRRIDLVTASPGGNMETIGQTALKAGRRVRLSALCADPDRFPGAESIDGGRR